VYYTESLDDRQSHKAKTLTLLRITATVFP